MIDKSSSPLAQGLGYMSDETTLHSPAAVTCGGPLEPNMVLCWCARIRKDHALQVHFCKYQVP